MTIGIDFDGCLVSWNFPLVGKDIGSAEVCRDLVKKGVKIILYTMRDNEFLDDAVKWCKDNKIELYGINENPSQDWSNSRKVHADIYIDDQALGCPLKEDKKISERPFVDWVKIRKMLEDKGIL